MFFEKKKTENVERTEEKTTPAISYVVQEAFTTAQVQRLPVGGVGVFFVDPGKEPGVLVTKKILKNPVVVYRISEKVFNFFNHQLLLSGGIKVAEGNEALAYGRDMTKTQISAGFYTSKFNCIALNVQQFEKNLKEKFRGVPIFIKV